LHVCGVCFTVLEIKNERVRFIAGLTEINKISCFAEYLPFGATGVRGNVVYFFSPAKYIRIDPCIT